jgi:DNA-binding response OmpR family regulator
MAQILLIEPDDVLAEHYSTAITYAGHNVFRVRGAQEAINYSDTVKPDVVVMEIQLSEHNGVEFLYEFRSYPEWQNTPVIVLSSVPPTEFKHTPSLWEELAVLAYHYKPRTSLKQLVSSISSLVSATI